MLQASQPRYEYGREATKYFLAGVILVPCARLICMGRGARVNKYWNSQHSSRGALLRLRQFWSVGYLEDNNNINEVRLPAPESFLHGARF